MYVSYYDDGEPMGVNQAAYQALCLIVHVDHQFFSNHLSSPIAREAAVALIRDHWEQQKKVPPADH
jgi:hypothetical protein